MDTIYVILLVVAAASVAVVACLLGFLTSRRHSSTNDTYKYPVPQEPEAGAEVPTGELEEEQAVYKVSEKKSGELLDMFKAYMAEHKPYLEPKPSIGAIATLLGTNKTTLSKLINDRFGMNYRQLLNSYRVKEAIDLFSKDSKMTMDELRKAAGFNSVSTFTSSFFRFTGCTPGEYCKKAASR